jgi:hypothetical protein
MSRGLGALQREILGALDAEHQEFGTTYDRRPYYDLHAVKETLARRGAWRLCRLHVTELQAVYVWYSGPFEASFSRAVRTLVKRGVLRREILPTDRGTWDFYHTYYVSLEPISVKSQ